MHVFRILEFFVLNNQLATQWDVKGLVGWMCVPRVGDGRFLLFVGGIHKDTDVFNGRTPEEKKSDRIIIYEKSYNQMIIIKILNQYQRRITVAMVTSSNSWALAELSCLVSNNVDGRKRGGW